MKRFNICCYNFSELNEFELQFINDIKGMKIGYFVEGLSDASMVNFPCYFISDLCGDPGINLCTDLESLYLTSNVSDNQRYFLLNDIKKIQNIKYSIFSSLLKKEPIISNKIDILYIVEQLLQNKGTYVDTEIRL